MNAYQNNLTDGNELSLILDTEPEQADDEVGKNQRHDFISILYSTTLNKSGVKLTKTELLNFFDSSEGSRYFRVYEREPENKSNLLDAVHALRLSLSVERQQEILAALESNGIRLLPSVVVSPSVEEEPEAPLSETAQNVLEFLSMHRYQNYTSHQVGQELEIEDSRKVWKALKKLLARKKPQVVEDRYVRGSTPITRYKYCPEWHDLHCPETNRLNVMCQVIRRVLTDHPGDNRRKLQAQVKDYLLRVDNRLRDDAIYLMIETGALVAEPGKQGAKNYRYNANWRTEEKARIYNQVMQSERFKRYR